MKCRMRDGEEESSGVKGYLCKGSGASCTETTENKALVTASLASDERNREFVCVRERYSTWCSSISVNVQMHL